MKSVSVIVRQWNGRLGYELSKPESNEQHPPDLLANLLSAGLNLYITRYVSTMVKRQPSHIPFTNNITYYVNPHMHGKPMYLTVDKPKQPLVLYEIHLLFRLVVDR
jgi:hypothetical protein